MSSTAKVFISWSGGKETSLACYNVMRQKDVKVACLLNMVSEDGRHSRSHGLGSGLLKAQAEAMGIPIVQRRTTWGTYEGEFKAAVSGLRKEGIQAGVFGDIDLQEHRDWVERVCRESGIKAILPLWERERGEILKEFINSGFEAIIVATQADKLGPEWLGRKIDNKFVCSLKKMNGIDLCGEAGEYHTYVISGPIFKKRINVLKTKKIKKDNHHFLDILDYEIAEKN